MAAALESAGDGTTSPAAKEGPGDARPLAARSWSTPTAH
jgi:hypothetical protein